MKREFDRRKRKHRTGQSDPAKPSRTGIMGRAGSIRPLRVFSVREAQILYMIRCSALPPVGSHRSGRAGRLTRPARQYAKDFWGRRLNTISRCSVRPRAWGLMLHKTQYLTGRSAALRRASDSCVSQVGNSCTTRCVTLGVSRVAMRTGPGNIPICLQALLTE